ncbi:trypsin-like peptidase domain-containing protein [Pseudoalteromonas sp. KG3]|uniref:Trypsin-like peptidase domain-containing protein n=1 Tax=Pseudoalteromonas prydzensis TaxID=182141 RepID=A0ABR9FMA0_9GAMM|nr:MULTISPECIES: trypsin-like peptidase domain-containing protein [Pseudoalteromonas]MBE0457953.1 trypsin-like peptidase domain-containing protein [Pseudoalteromonas prydzensis]WKD26218.1 trypsin-like peptidase domain-containing protein [Pseudoalteromonas sp. KG3]
MKLFFLVCLGLVTSLANAKDYSSLYEKLDQSVVVIYADTDLQRIENDRAVKTTSSSLGTGSIINDEGLILTAAHVVNDADELTVDVPNRGHFKAKVLASYAPADIALIKLISTETDFKTIKIADSDKAAIGEEVFIIGTPYGLSHTLTVGHLSGRRIHPSSDENLKLEFLQTDAAINQGNSGGPMFNQKGQLIGVVSYIQTQSGGNEGLGFAASSNLVKQMLIERPTIWFGTHYTTLPSGITAALNIPQRSGLLIERVSKQSFADQVGLKGGLVQAVIQGQPLTLGGDVILAVGPHVITGEKTNIERITSYIKELKAGTAIEFTLMRAGRVIKLSAPKPATHIKLL